MAEVEITILGGGQEVGRSAILLTVGDTNILLDYGVQVSEEEPGFPLHVRPKDLSAIFLTHAHLDHSGALPLLYVTEQKPLFTTPLTLELSEMLILDFMKVSRYYVPYEVIELQSMLKSACLVDYSQRIEISSKVGIEVEVLNAGHIPGSAAFLINVEDTTILYTGDYNSNTTCLLTGANLPTNVDVLITEATYALYNHPPREKVEKELIGSIEEVLDSGGTVLIPTFSVGRAQEIILLLAKYGLSGKYKVYLDGMARTVAETLMKYPNYLRDPDFYAKAFSSVTFISNHKARKKALKESSIIVSPAGMLKGGPAAYYAEKLVSEEKNGIFFVSFQAPLSRGRMVLEEGIFEIADGKGKFVKARVEWFDLSSHCGRDQLINFIEKTPKHAKIVIVHCTEKGGNFLRQKLEESSREVYLPKNGDKILLEL